MNVIVLQPNPAISAETSNQADALVLNCMDYRLVGAVADYLDTRGLRGKYDQIVLAGSAIGVMSDQTTARAETFWQHVSLARKHHGIHKIIVIDHRDCGACKPFIRRDCADFRQEETAIHMKWMEALADEIVTREPGLEVEMLLMDLDGSIETIDA